MNFRSKYYLPIILIILYSTTGLIPNLGSVDRIGPQWVYMSTINLLGLVYLWSSFKEFKSIFQKLFEFKPFIFLTFFVFYGLVSYFYADNQIEVIIQFFRWICVLIGFFIVSSILYFLEKDFLIISILFSVILLIELYFPYSTYFQLTSITDYNIEFGNFLKGAAGNKNISAASILIKTPFLFYLINETKNLPTRIILALISSSAFYLIFLLSARAAILSTIFLLIILLIFNLIRYYKTKNHKLFFNSILYLILPILFSASAFQFQYGSKDNTVSLATRVSSVNTTDESTLQRLRFYKHSFTQIFNNPIFGVGSGNWKVKSIDYDKKQMEGFTVPYHVHNDFLEIGTELGLIGLFIYLAIFIYTVVFVLKQLSKETKLKELAPQALILLLGGVIYFTDANLNFPFARPVNQIPFIVYLALFFSLKTNSLSDEKI